MNAHSPSRPAPLASHRSPYAVAHVAAYALGATLWAPVLAAIAGIGTDLTAWLAPELPVASHAGLLAVVWALRFVFYVIGAQAGWSYGYGINGVIVNRALSLPEKARRVASDWFGILLMLVWLALTIKPLAAAFAL